MWYDELQPASFRGVPFSVHDSNRSEGLNTVLREYPFQDLPTVFSMGQASGKLTFSAYVIGDDYIQKMNALEQALLVQESGVLVHPSIGSMRVWFHGEVTIDENFVEEGGMARFKMTFVRAEARRYPTEASNTALSAFSAALQGAIASVQAFAGRYNLNGVAGWVRANVLNNILLLHSAIFEVCYAIKQGTDGFDDLLRMGRTAEDVLKDALLIPQDLGAHYLAMLGIDKNLDSTQAANITAALLPIEEAAAPLVLLPSALPVRDPKLADLLNFTVEPSYSPYATASRKVEAECAAALTSLVQRLAYCALVQAASQMTFDNYDTALRVRRAVHAHGKRLLLAASTEDSPLSIDAGVGIHDALMAVHSAALTHLHAESVELARLVTFTPAAEDNIWSISYQLYGTDEFADEVWSMNPHITNPLLVPAGQALRVIDRK